MTTQENNKLIAEFMGYKLMPCNRGKAWDIGKSIPSKDHLFPIQGVLHTGNELKFHSSWDWIMPVVEKINTIEDYKYSVSINYHYTTITDNQLTEIIVDEDTDTDTRSGCYKAVIEFINQYNK